MFQQTTDILIIQLYSVKMTSYKSTCFWTLIYISVTLVQTDTVHGHHDHPNTQDPDPLGGSPESTMSKTPMDSSNEDNFLETEASLYVNLIFQKFGHNHIMTFEGFEHFLSSVGLGDIVIKDHDIHDHIKDGKNFRNLHDTHLHNDTEKEDLDAGVSRIQNVIDASHEEHDHHHHRHHGHQDNDHSNKTRVVNSNNTLTQESSDTHTTHEKNRQRTGGSMDQSRQIADNMEGHGDDEEKSRAAKTKKGRMKNNKKTDVHMGKSDKMDTKISGDEQEIGDAETNAGKQDDEYEDEDAHGLQFPGNEANQSSSQGNQNSNSRNARALAAEKHPHEHSDLDEICPSPKQFLSIFHVQDENIIREDDFLHMCSAILYHIEVRSCSRTPTSCLEHIDWSEHCKKFHAGDDPNGEADDWSDDLEEKHYHGDDSHSDDDDDEDEDGFLGIPGKVWGFALASVTVISLVGLVCVAVVPVMNKLLFNHLVQFLVALAVGTLTGDALLHLIPHALVPHNATSHDSDGEDDSSHGSEGEGSQGHSEAIWKGMAVLGGIYLFFLSERVLAIVNRRKTEAKLKKKKQEALLRETELDIFNPRELEIGEKLSRHNDKYASHHDIKDQSQARREIRLSLILSDDYASSLAELSEKEHHSHNDDHSEHSLEHHEGHSHSEGQGHNHGHSHEAPGSVSSVAWMVIMGDGLHNFSDGLAIGAAFANSVTVGLSTSIAVFCHELPHELGDFAVLLKAGMSVKHALFYNIVSSVLSYLGMAIGVAVGNIEEASSWIFLVTAGIFIYISLVDMLPEISHGEKSCHHLVLQILGISTGVAIMLIIALFENRIKVG